MEELLYPDELCQAVVDVRSSRQKETAAGAQIVEEEQLLVLGRKKTNKKNNKTQHTLGKIKPVWKVSLKGNKSVSTEIM